MKTEFYDSANFKRKQARGKSSVNDNSTDRTSCQFISLSNFDKLNSEARMRNCIEQKASQGNYAVAIALLNQLIALRPDSATDYNNRGLMYFRNNQITEALADLSQALQLDPKLDSAYNNRANCYAARGELDKAVADYELALDLNPANLRAWINQGITFREMGIYDLAIENFDIASIIGNRLQERIYAERGRCYHLRGDWNCAVADYKQALELLKTKPQLAGYQYKVQTWLDSLFNHLVF
ncbi:MAG: tetratricopeptide repeat protein [Pleurocapsa sp.]